MHNMMKELAYKGDAQLPFLGFGLLNLSVRRLICTVSCVHPSSCSPNETAMADGL